jgi:hypothetical protein
MATDLLSEECLVDGLVDGGASKIENSRCSQISRPLLAHNLTSTLYAFDTTATAFQIT